jgi:hypothetical protein
MTKFYLLCFTNFKLLNKIKGPSANDADFSKSLWFPLVVATAIPCNATAYKQGRTKVGPTGQLPGTLTRFRNNLKYGDIKLKQ